MQNGVSKCEKANNLKLRVRILPASRQLIETPTALMTRGKWFYNYNNEYMTNNSWIPHTNDEQSAPYRFSCAFSAVTRSSRLTLLLLPNYWSIQEAEHNPHARAGLGSSGRKAQNNGSGLGGAAENARVRTVHRGLRSGAASVMGSATVYQKFNEILFTGSIQEFSPVWSPKVSSFTNTTVHSMI